jgi:glycosyltransferase involved in cell wall biosynthesis
MLYVGSINSRKNLLGVVKALETLPKDLQMPLVVVGGGREYKVEVQKYISAHNLDNLVIFPSKRIDDDTLQALYTNARLFVYPSFYEGFGLPVVEALLSGCPVVTSNVSSLPEAGGPHSLMVNPSDVDDIADKMRLALTDSVLYAEMKRDGYDYAVSTFHPKVLAERLMSVYRKVL